jgi:hypothetical protein
MYHQYDNKLIKSELFNLSETINITMYHQYDNKLIKSELFNLSETILESYLKDTMTIFFKCTGNRKHLCIAIYKCILFNCMDVS